MRRAPRARTPDGSLGDAGRLRAQRQSEVVLALSGAVIAVNLLLFFASAEAGFVMGFYVGQLALTLFVASLWQRGLGRKVDFAEAVAPRADRMHALAAALDGGRVEEFDGQVTVRGRRGGVEVSARCWVREDPLPDEDTLELRLPTLRPTPWNGTYRGLLTPSPGGRRVPDVYVHGERKPPLTSALHRRLLNLLHAVERAQLDVDGTGFVLRLPANEVSFTPGQAEWCLDQLIDVARALEQPLSDAPALDVTVRPANLEGAGNDCPYCRTPVKDDAWRCRACRTEHHRACQVEHGGCTVLGCSGGPDRTRARA